MLLYINDSDVCRLNIVLSIHHKKCIIRFKRCLCLYEYIIFRGF
ncbi:orf; Unknown function [Escherichia coli ISC7]|uniref:Uncharacterized protein n=1 Tax=Escherichia coli ISC7 TaxID=1432555 RepID=W1F3T1_ECOLX|nr:orf; Unknown function [Escherichia coli ISC7]